MKRLIPFFAIALLAVPSLTKAVSCDGAFTLLGLVGDQDTIVPAGNLPGSFLVKGTYVEFTVDSATFGVRDWTLTGVPSSLDITGGRRTAVFASKMPDHKGLTLTSGVTVQMNKESIVISRDAPGLSMKIQAKDCASGGLFQMEVARADLTETVFTHVLADGIFYFDNPNVRNRLGELIPCSGILPDGTPVEIAFDDSRLSPETSNHGMKSSSPSNWRMKATLVAVAKGTGGSKRNVVASDASSAICTSCHSLRDQRSDDNPVSGICGTEFAVVDRNNCTPGFEMPDLLLVACGFDLKYTSIRSMLAVVVLFSLLGSR